MEIINQVRLKVHNQINLNSNSNGFLSKNTAIKTLIF